MAAPPGGHPVSLTKGRKEAGIYYGWYVLVAAFITLLMSFGTNRVFGLALKPILSEMGTSRAGISLAPAINLVAGAFSFWLMGRLSDRYGAEKVIAWCALLTSAGLLALGYAASLWQVVLLYGIILGLASGGTSMVTNALLVSQWFPQKRGTALSLSLSGASTGQLILVPFSAYLMVTMGWRNTYLALGVLFALVVLPLAVFVMKPSPSWSGEHLRRSGSLAKQVKEATLLGRKAQPFWVLSGIMFICGYQDFVFLLHFIPHATDLGYSPLFAGKLLGLAGAFTIPGTLVIGAVLDRVGGRPPLVAIFLLRLVAFAFALISASRGNLYAYALTFGMTIMATGVLAPAILANFYGPANLGSLLGLNTFIHHLGAASGAFLTGWAFDLAGSYSLSFYSGLVLALVASGLASTISQRRPSPISSPLPRK